MWEEGSRTHTHTRLRRHLPLFTLFEQKVWSMVKKIPFNSFITDRNLKNAFFGRIEKEGTAPGFADKLNQNGPRQALYDTKDIKSLLDAIENDSLHNLFIDDEKVNQSLFYQLFWIAYKDKDNVVGRIKQKLGDNYEFPAAKELALILSVIPLETRSVKPVNTALTFPADYMPFDREKPPDDANIRHDYLPKYSFRETLVRFHLNLTLSGKVTVSNNDIGLLAAAINQIIDDKTSIDPNKDDAVIVAAAHLYYDAFSRYTNAVSAYENALTLNNVTNKKYDLNVKREVIKYHKQINDNKPSFEFNFININDYQEDSEYTAVVNKDDVDTEKRRLTEKASPGVFNASSTLERRTRASLSRQFAKAATPIAQRNVSPNFRAMANSIIPFDPVEFPTALSILDESKDAYPEDADALNDLKDTFILQSVVGIDTQRKDNLAKPGNISIDGTSYKSLEDYVGKQNINGYLRYHHYVYDPRNYALSSHAIRKILRNNVPKDTFDIDTTRQTVINNPDKYSVKRFNDALFVRSPDQYWKKAIFPPVYHERKTLPKNLPERGVRKEPPASLCESPYQSPAYLKDFFSMV